MPNPTPTPTPTYTIGTGPNSYYANGKLQTHSGIVINLPQLDPKAALNMLGMGQRPQASISPFQGGYSTMLSGASTALHNPTYFVDKMFLSKQDTNPPPPQSFGGTARNPFGFMQNPFNQMQAWQQRVSPFVRQGAGGAGGSVSMGNGNSNGMSAGEAKWASIAGKLGLNWQVVKDVYMNPNRNGTPNVSQAIERAADDKAWGDAAARFGILTGNAERDALVWQEHYNATHYGGRDPMDGHNEAYQAYMNNQAAMEQQANGTPQYPDWYQTP